MKIKFIPFLLLFTATLTYSDYRVQIPLEKIDGGNLPDGSINIEPPLSVWLPATPLVGNWFNDGSIYDCTNWSPDPTTIPLNQTFTQTATDCKQNQNRSVQQREQETKTLEYRNVGPEVIENQTIVVSDTRDSIGSLENWMAIAPSYTMWANVSGVYGCSNWAPEPSTITIGQNYTQTATNCSQDQTRDRQNREQETNTLTIRNNGVPIVENQTITTSNTRGAVGTLETWVATTPTYTSWVNSGSKYGCSNWSPATNTVTNGQNFTQTATNCSQNQTRNRQNREQETTTLAYRNSGAVIVENQTLTNQTDTRNAVGTYVAAITPTVSSFTVYSKVVVLCGGSGNMDGQLRWTGSNASYYVLSGPDGTINVGTATSRNTKKTGTFTITAYSSTGHTASRSVVMTSDWEPCG